jgi:hypothetical protein
VALELSQVSSINAGEIILGIVSFFTVSLGGLVIGILCGVLAAIFTKYTGDLRGLALLFLYYFVFIYY